MRVLLVRPPWFYPITKVESTYNRIWPPLSLANCAAVLREDNHEVTIIDAHAEKFTPAEVTRRAKNYDYIFITSSPLDRWQCPNLDLEPFIETARLLSEMNSQVYVMGYHGTVAPKLILKRVPKAKAVIRGEPEEIISQICKEKSLSQIKGLTYRKGRQKISNRDRPPVDLTKLPRPAFESLPLDKYLYEILGNKFMLFEFSRGCPFRCTFCSKDVMYKKGVRKKTLKQITAELDYAIDKLGIRNAYFFDLEFNVLGYDLIKRLCKYLIKRGSPLKWCCQLRADKISSELLSLMKKAGCQLIHCGMETGSKKSMERINKAFSTEELAKGVDRIDKSGIKTLGFFMFGLPWEKEKDVWETIDFAKHTNLTYASFHLANPYPKTKYESYGKKKNLESVFINQSCSRYFTTEELQGFIKYALLHFYLQPKRFLRLLVSGDTKLLFHQFKLMTNYLFK